MGKRLCYIAAFEVKAEEKEKGCSTNSRSSESGRDQFVLVFDSMLGVAL